MAYDHRDQPPGTEQGAAEDQGKWQEERQMLSLEELIYASIQPLAASNQRLQMHILEEIQAVSQVEQRQDQKVARLKNLHVAYDKLRSDGEGASRLEQMELQLPLLSLVSLSQLAVDKAKVAFHAEVVSESDGQGGTQLRGRVSTSKERKISPLSRISYEIELSSIPVAEGLMRLTDLLDISPVAREVGETLLDSSGRPRSEQEQALHSQVRERKEKIRQLQGLYQKVQEFSEERERLAQLCTGASDGQPCRRDNKFAQTAQREMVQRIIQEQEKLIRMEVEQELGQSLSGVSDQK